MESQDSISSLEDQSSIIFGKESLVGCVVAVTIESAFNEERYLITQEIEHLWLLNYINKTL